MDGGDNKSFFRHDNDCPLFCTIFVGWTDGRTDGRRDGRTDGRTGGRLDGRTGGRREGPTDVGARLHETEDKNVQHH